MDGKDTRYIRVVSNISEHVSKQYIEMIEQYVKEPKNIKKNA